MGNERKRWYARRNRSMTPVTVKSANGVYFGYIRDISCSGISMFGIRPLPVGEKCDIEFRLTDMHDPIKCSATVRWNWPTTQSMVSISCQGLMFDDVEPCVAERLDDWVTGKTPRLAA
ncbi:MAG TPA: PilZ domain-containing protein [Nitrospirota bacterium]